MTSALQKAKEACAHLKSAVTSSNPDNAKATATLEELKVQLYIFPEMMMFIFRLFEIT